MGGQGDRRRSDLTRARVADAAFGALCLAALGLLATIGVEQWFFLDEWDFLSDRTAWDLDDLLRPHNEHWSSIPILLYRGMYRAFGLQTYVPYRLMAVAAHVLCAVLMRALLRRQGVGPWLSVAVVLPWIFFGSGWQNIVWGFQVAWTSALALCTAQLLLADHEGPRGARDALALAAGLAALMCAGIAAPLIGTGAFVLWLRRGWRVALLHSAPLAVVQVLWGTQFGEAPFLEAPTGDNAEFVWRGLSGTLEAYAWTWPVALALTVAGLVGTWLRWRAAAPGARAAAVAIPVGLALGAAGYLLFVSFGRVSFGLGFATSSRYLHVIAFLLLPLVGTGVAELVARSQSLPRAPGLLAGGVLVALLLAGLPGNVREFSHAHLARRIHVGNPTFVRAVATAVTEDDVLPAEGRPTTAAPDASIGWLRSAVADGYLDPLPDDDPVRARLVQQSLQLVQIGEDFDRVGTCTPMDDPISVAMDTGDRVSFSVYQVRAEITSPTVGSFTKTFNANYGYGIQATAPLEVVFTNVHAAKEGHLCRR